MHRYSEQDFAEELHRSLKNAGIAEVALSGSGVHWQCSAARDARRCVIDCFETQGPQYALSFHEAAQCSAEGRTRSREETVAAVGSWLNGETIQALYDRFAFVDFSRRSLERLHEQIVRAVPGLTPHCSLKSRYELREFQELTFARGDRSCVLSFYGEETIPRAWFSWDECSLFRVPTDDPQRLASALKLWILDGATPSALSAQCPGIEMGRLAQYYEEGRGVEGEFLLSWDSVETFYAGRDPEASAFIAQLRAAGYDRLLRAGQSMFTFIVARSRRHGLRDQQPRILVNFHEKGMEIEVRMKDQKTYSFSKAELSPPVDALLKELAATPLT